MSELEEGLKQEEDEIECPYQGESGCDDCTENLTPDLCEEYYEEYLLYE